MDGGTDMYTRCNEMAKELVENHKVAELPSDVKDKIQRHRRQGREGRGSRLSPAAPEANPRRGGQRILWQTLRLSRR